MQPNKLSRDLDILEAEVELTLRSPLLPDAKRAELEQRHNAIKAKAAPQGSLRSDTSAAARDNDQ